MAGFTDHPLVKAIPAGGVLQVPQKHQEAVSAAPTEPCVPASRVTGTFFSPPPVPRLPDTSERLLQPVLQGPSSENTTRGQGGGQMPQEEKTSPEADASPVHRPPTRTVWRASPCAQQGGVPSASSGPRILFRNNYHLFDLLTTQHLPRGPGPEHKNIITMEMYPAAQSSIKTKGLSSVAATTRAPNTQRAQALKS